MFAPSRSAAATGPGCGGTNACMTAKAPAAGKTVSNDEAFKRRATLSNIGIITINPASKNIGKPKSKDVTPSAKGAFWIPNRVIILSASTSAPPLVPEILAEEMDKSRNLLGAYAQAKELLFEMGAMADVVAIDNNIRKGH